MKTIHETEEYKFGIELECFADEISKYAFVKEVKKRKLPFIFKDDGSIHVSNSDTQESMEIVCTRGLYFPKLLESVTQLSDLAAEYKVKVNDSCGFHVHISNAKFFNHGALKRIVFLWCAIEDVLYATQPESRLTNSYTKRLLKKFLADYHVSLPKAKRKLVNYLGDTDRYFSLNLASLRRHGTLECRMHSATVKSEKIINWVRLLVSIYDYALKRYNHEEVLALFNTPISDEKKDKVFALLGLESDLQTYFTGRLNKFLYQKLGKSQEAAIKAFAILPQYVRGEKAYQRISRKLEEQRSNIHTILRSV